MDEHASVSGIIEEVKRDICDNYCKFTADELVWPCKLDEETLERICDDCPLNRL